MSRAGELFSLRAAPQWGHCNSCFKVLGMKCAVLPAPPWELWGFSHPFGMVLVLSFFVFVAVPPFSSLTEAWRWEWTNPHPFPWIECAVPVPETFVSPCCSPSPSGKETSWKWHKQCSQYLQLWRLCFNGVVLVPVGSPCSGAVWVFPRNAELAFRLRDTNVTPCHAGLWVLFLGHSGVAFTFRLQQFRECLFYWIMQKSIPVFAVLTD